MQIFSFLRCEKGGFPSLTLFWRLSSKTRSGVIFRENMVKQYFFGHRVKNQIKKSENFGSLPKTIFYVDYAMDTTKIKKIPNIDITP